MIFHPSFILTMFSKRFKKQSPLSVRPYNGFHSVISFSVLRLNSLGGSTNTYLVRFSVLCIYSCVTLVKNNWKQNVAAITTIILI